MRWALVLAAAALKTSGVVVVATHFEARDPWLFCGLTAVLVGALFANAAFNCTLARTLDEEFSAGYRVGYRAGRRAPLVPQAVADLDSFRQRRSEDGRIQATPVRAVAGDGAYTRWSPQDAN